jgi:beta-lactamase regulating signal transducer with metallopeptidase domain
MIQGVLNHLWQSTLLVGVIALLTWLFRGHGAQVRYGLWFAASCKFLLPFSLLIFLGGHFHWRLTNSPTAAPVLSRVVAPFATSEAIVSPGTNRTTPATTAQTLTAASPIGASAAVSRSLPLLALGLWACGCAFVLGRWIMRWRRIQRAVNESAALPIAAPVPVRASAATLEPGVIGIWRPILLLPMGIEERLTPPQLQSIILHEIAHVRRRDNLTAALHMLVEALFWFYPLVWWVGAQLIRERESACDEAALASGCSPQIYAEGILNVCKYYMQLSVACAAGVAGADLKKRIESIMTPRQLRRLTAAGAVVISSAAVLTLLIPITLGAVLATPSRAQAQQSAIADDVRLTRTLLRQQRYEELDQRMNGFQYAYRSGSPSEEGLLQEFSAFELADPDMEPNLDAWIATYPNSYAAHLARGIHYFKSGVQTRGNQDYDHTTSAQLHGMQLYLEKARQDLQDSLALDPKPMVSYGILMRTNMQLGDQTAVRTLLNTALKLDPRALIPRRAYLRSIQTRWGGSLEQMIDFVQSSKAAALTPGQLADLQQFVDDERKWLEARNGLPNEGAVASN